MKPKSIAARNDKNRFRAFKLAPLIALLLFATVSAQKKNSCVECHSQMEGALSDPVRLSKRLSPSTVETQRRLSESGTTLKMELLASEFSFAGL